MREPVQQNSKAESRLGIRTGVWLFVFGSVFICVLTLRIVRHPTSQLAHDVASESLLHQESSTHEIGSPKAAHLESAPATYESGANFDLDKAQLALIERMTQDRRTWLDDPE